MRNRIKNMVDAKYIGVVSEIEINNVTVKGKSIVVTESQHQTLYPLNKLLRVVNQINTIDEGLRIEFELYTVLVRGGTLKLNALYEQIANVLI